MRGFVVCVLVGCGCQLLFPHDRAAGAGAALVVVPILALLDIIAGELELARRHGGRS